MAKAEESGFSLDSLNTALECRQRNFRVLGLRVVVAEDQKSYVEGKAIFIQMKDWAEWEELNPCRILSILFKIPLEAPEEEVEAEEGVAKGLPESDFQVEFEHLVIPSLHRDLVNRALVGREDPVVEIMEDTYINIKENVLFERNYEMELEALWKDLGAVNKEDFVNLIVRLIDLGYEFSGIIERLEMAKILENLSKEGWSEGLLYFNLIFNRN